MAVRNGDLVSVTLPDPPSAKSEHKTVMKALQNLRAKEETRLQEESQRSYDLIQQAIAEAKKGGGKYKGKIADTKSKTAIDDFGVAATNIVEPATMELKPMPRYFDFMGEVSLSMFLCVVYVVCACARARARVCVCVCVCVFIVEKGRKMQK